ncbi:hypothetical protein QBC35DRAFT_295139 [Podospora australis]|uniref:Secreted protein n=1 Tax=Podospora australis TaxID=1536484 RepID=A0AAN7AM16_9PEZI|nr:hypothetical protein QBC35DRAFT_295139 [Podospora australis]
MYICRILFLVFFTWTPNFRATSLYFTCCEAINTSGTYHNCGPSRQVFNQIRPSSGGASSGVSFQKRHLFISIDLSSPTLPQNISSRT